MPSESSRLNAEGLRKELALFDVYVICTGAMFSSGFFLLPGIAAAKCGPSVFLAYLVSGILILPAMLSQAELATTMPRSGGAYYFLDRALGPMVGTVGGVGTWLTLVLKSAFALIGMGAYLAIFLPDLNIAMLTVVFTLVFGALNVIGTKESSRVVRVLVVALLGIMAFFIVHGVSEVLSGGLLSTHEARFKPFMPHGIDGFLATVGLVFVSYVGLTKVASVAEEIKDPDRNIPLGMTLALATVTGIYVVGVYIMVAVLGLDDLSGSLTPVADAAGAFFSWVPSRVGVLLLVAAAIAAFAAMANAGIMSASRYPLAMARDRLVPEVLSGIGRYRTPTLSIVLTCALLILFLLFLNVERVAKLASALQLLIFALINVAVIVMRESHIEAYDPGFRSPLYPWVQIVGITFPFVLIVEMGWLPVLFTVGVAVVSVAWYLSYARKRVVRTGAIFHIFARLGQRQFKGLDMELRGILQEKGLRSEDPYDEVVARSFVIDFDKDASFEQMTIEAADLLATRVDMTPEELAAGLIEGKPMGVTPCARGVALPHMRVAGLEQPEMVLVRSREGVRIGAGTHPQDEEGQVLYHAIVYLVSPLGKPGQHLRILAQLAEHVVDEDFMATWLKAERRRDMRQTLIRDDRFLALRLRPGTKTAAFIGKRVRELSLPRATLMAVIHRSREVIVPRGSTVLEEGDRVEFIGEVSDIGLLYDRYTETDDDA
ncbi:amino acid permease [Planctomycetota bacterium]